MAISFQLSQQNAILTRTAYRGKLNAFEENVIASTILHLGMEKPNVKVSFIHLFTTNLRQKCAAHCHFSTPRKKEEIFFLMKFFFLCKRIAVSVFVVVKRVQPVSQRLPITTEAFRLEEHLFYGLAFNS